MSRTPEVHEPWSIPEFDLLDGCSCGDEFTHCVEMGRAA